MMEPMTRQVGSVPSPDPTVLTTQALYREIGALRELIDQRLLGLNAELQRDRLAAEHAESLLSRERGEQFGSLREVVDEQILTLTKTVALQFDLVERQRVEQKKDTKDAVDAALTAQKEAVREQTAASDRAIAKSEAATTKLLEQLSQTFATSADAQRRVTDELKERIGEVATAANGSSQLRAGSRETFGDMRSLALVAFAAAGFIVAVLVALLK